MSGYTSSGELRHGEVGGVWNGVEWDDEARVNHYMPKGQSGCVAVEEFEYTRSVKENGCMRKRVQMRDTLVLLLSSGAAAGSISTSWINQQESRKHTSTSIGYQKA